MASPSCISPRFAGRREAQALVARVLDICGPIAPDPVDGRAMQAARLLTTTAGLATQATYDPEGWPPHRQRAVLATELASVGAPPLASD
jgi:hypothetical protein